MTCGACDSERVTMQVSEDGDHFLCQCGTCLYEWFEEIIVEDDIAVLLEDILK